MIICGDSREAMRGLGEASVDAIVTDPPYELGFMGKGWDASGVAYCVDAWREALRVLKPGGHLLAFGGEPDPESFGPAQPSRYVQRVLKYGISTVLQDAKGMELTRAGIVRPNSLEMAVRKYRRRQNEKLALSLYRTIQTELWLRAKARPEEAAVVQEVKDRRRQRQRPIRPSNPKLEVVGS